MTRCSGFGASPCLTGVVIVAVVLLVPLVVVLVESTSNTGLNGPTIRGVAVSWYGKLLAVTCAVCVENNEKNIIFT